MNRSLRALGLLGLATVGLWCFGGGLRTPPDASASEVVAAPLAHENLCVYFVHGSDAVAGAPVLTLQEALDRGLAVVHETGDVNTLAVENRSPDCDLFVQSGDIVKGGQQDRMAAADLLVPPGAGRVPLPAHCVEQGRWTGRGTEDARRFKNADGFAVGNVMKFANINGQQGEVWQTVKDNQGKLTANLQQPVVAGVSPTSFQLTLEAPAVKAKVAGYEAALRNAGEARANVVGVVFVVNGQITGAEVYGSNALFRKAWPKLLTAAAVEAVAERTNTPTRHPTPRAVEQFLARGSDPEPALNSSRARVRTDLGEEIVQTEGRRAELVQTEGRLLQTEGRPQEPRTGNFVLGGSVNSDVGLIGSVPLNRPMPMPNAPPGVNPIAPIPEPSVPNAPPQRGAVLAAPIQELDRPVVPVNADGNRLTSNRTENRSTLMVESRDPARQNAVIHRSYIKK